MTGGGRNMKKIGRTFTAFILITLVIVPFVAGCSKATTDSGQSITEVSAQEAYQVIQDNASNPDFIIVDVRTPAEYSEGHVANAVNVDYNSGTFNDDIGKLDRSKTYLIYCHSGNRSRAALAVMKGLDFKSIYHMYEGIVGWNGAGYPTVQ